MERFIVTGIGTGIGKTVVSAILAEALGADYWKPVQCGIRGERDVLRVAELLENGHRRCHPESYCLRFPVSPHQAARMEGISLDSDQLQVPHTLAPLVIEGTGGVMAPFDDGSLLLDHLVKWGAKWIVVSKNYLGSINHTLLTIAALRGRGIEPLGIVFNGEPNADSERFILSYTGLPLFGRVFQEESVNSQTIKRYSEQWVAQFPACQLSMR